MGDTDLADLLDRFGNVHILVVGDAMLDRFVYGGIERISPEAPIPVLRADRTSSMAGGAGNVVRNCVALGAQASLVAVVGTDGEAEELAQHFAGMDAHLISDTQRRTTVKVRFVAERQQVFRADWETVTPVSAAVEAAVLDAFRAALPSSDIVIISDYAKGLLSESLTQQLIRCARGHAKMVLVDPKERDFGKYSGAAVITPNRFELQQACGRECLRDEQVVFGAREILEKGICDALVVTRGPDGVSVVRKDDCFHLRTAAHDVFDVTGAGDTVVSALALGLAAGGDLAASAALANVAAGIVVSKRGTATATPDEVMAAIRMVQDGEPARLFSRSRVLEDVARWRERGQTIAFTNGCFDLLHPGHVSLLKQAKAAADRLVVGLNSDESVRRLKGPARPVQSELARATVLASLKCVDAVIIFNEDTPLEIIKMMSPDILVKGANYSIETVVGAREVIARGGRVVLADFLDGHSTTSTLQRVGRTPAERT